MTQALDHERSLNRSPSRWLAFFAHATAAYPLLLLGSLYGEWLLSWWVLGHRPRPSLDDPKSIDATIWMHIVTYLALRGFAPAGCVAVVLNTLYAINHRVRGSRLLVRVAVIAALWLGTFALLRWDPGLVLFWWFD